ncbi:hypothetical protein AMJ83_10325 [candidate division WOR_3 bacterium SM23_42]|uniref:GON domain-containing protein n=1 Tax=candidate division WOR_3 bacterium SM23_42 TaxID=1703779 RepID=A0A0S8FT71_UNCW3|nr:MAG: hypothetical protein AMJ83_10325 [candidate division WOR_3 bacterium SM23_42]
MNYELEKKYHISYCGSYCHICDWHTGKIRKTFQLASDMIDNLALKKQIGNKLDIERFKEGLRNLANSSICPGCKAEAGVRKPDEDRCRIRQCCYNKNFDLCNECSDFPCETLKSNPGVIKFRCIENLQEIKQKGLREWIDRQWKNYVTEPIEQ